MSHTTSPFRSRRVFGIGLIALSAATWVGCSGSPIEPTPTPKVNLRLQGLVLDADREEPLPGALVTAASVHIPGASGPVVPPASATSDQNGLFVLDAALPAAWTDLKLSVASPGYEPQSSIWTVKPADTEVTLKAYRSVTIRPGEALDLRVTLGNVQCGMEGHMCRRVAVESAGQPIEVEAIAVESSAMVGLVVGDPGLGLMKYEPRVTVSGGEVWILAGNRGKVKVTGRAVGEQR